MMLVLGLMCQYLSGKWWPRRTSEARRSYLRANRVSGTVFAWALLAGGVIDCRLGRVLDCAVPAREDARQRPCYPLHTTVLVIAMASLVSPITEEAAFRGYCQVILERQFTAPIAVLISSAFFTAAHVVHGFLVPKLLVYFLAGVVFGVMAYVANSTVPAIPVHIIGDLTFFTLVWRTTRHDSWSGNVMRTDGSGSTSRKRSSSRCWRSRPSSGWRGSASVSHLDHSAINEQLHAVDETRVAGGKEDHDGGDFVRLPCPAEWDALGHLVEHGGSLVFAAGEFLDRGRDDRPGADDIHPDLAIFELDHPRACQRSNRRFGGVVNAELPHPFAAGDRPVEDDARTVTQQRQGLLHGEEHAFDVDVEILVEVGFGGLGQRHELPAAGVGEDHVEPAVLLLDRGIELVEVGQLGDVALHGSNVLADLLGRHIELGLPPAGDVDVL